MTATGSAPAPLTAVRVLDAYGRLPLRFESNQGQTDSRVKFVARGDGYDLFLTATEAVMVFRQPGRAQPSRISPEGAKSQVGEKASATVLRMRLVGANSATRTRGLDELPGKVNYFIGGDPARWRTNVPTYAKVKYENVYPGIDLIYYGYQRQLEYDFIVAPGADPELVTLAFEEADHLEIDSRGDLIIHGHGGRIRQKAPFIYQDVEGVRQTISGRYVVKGKRLIGIQVGAYDASRSLIIDPVLLYSTLVGGSSLDLGFGIAVDSFGNAYVTGETLSMDFPTANPFQGVLGGFRLDAFVTKLNPEGSAIVYSTHFGGTGNDTGDRIAVDAAGNAYVTGTTSSVDFPTTPQAFQKTFRGGSSRGDIFVVKLNPAGSELLYSTYLGGSGDEWPAGIAVDADGNACVVGTTGFGFNPPTPSTDFPTTPGALQPVFPGSPKTVILTKLNHDGSALLYSTYLGGSGGDGGGGIAVDAGGNIYVTGSAASPDFPTTAGAFQTVLRADSNAFVAKIDPSQAGRASLVYSTYLGGSVSNFLPGGDSGSGIAVDAAGNAYVTGTATTRDFPTASPIQPLLPRLAGFASAFVSKLNPEGSALVYSTYLGGRGGGAGTDQGFAISVDSSRNAHVTGLTASTDFPITLGAFQTRFGGGFTDTFVATLDSTGTVLRSSTYLGGSGEEHGKGIALDAAGNAYVVGQTTSADFPAVPGAFQTALRGCCDAFAAKFSGEEGLIPLQFVAFPASFPSLPPEGEVGKFYVGNIGIGGGRPPYTVRIARGSLPPGLSFNSPVISGSPTQVLAAIFTLQVQDQLSVIEKEFQITIRPSATLLTLQASKAGTGSGTVTSTPDGIACGAVCVAFYGRDTAVTLTAVPAGDSSLTGWSGDCAGQGNPCSLIMTSDKSVGATFDLSSRGPTATIVLSGSQFRPGQRLTLGIEVENPPGSAPADLYVGVVLSDGQTAVFFSGPGVLASSVRLADPAQFPRMQAAPPGFVLTNARFFEFTLPQSGIAPGTYQVFAALVREGALADNRIDPGDVLALDVKLLTVSP